MSDYNEGDLVRLTKGENRIQGRVHDRIKIGDTYRSVPGCTSAGFTLTVLERAKPPLPTEDGHYLDNEGSVWKRSCGTWMLLSASVAVVESARSGGFDPADYTPFRRLVPEVTA